MSIEFNALTPSNNVSQSTQEMHPKRSALSIKHKLPEASGSSKKNLKSKIWSLWHAFCNMLKWLVNKIKNAFTYCFRGQNHSKDRLSSIQQEINLGIKSQIEQKKILRRNITTFINFINSHSDLKELCQKELSANPNCIDIDGMERALKITESQESHPETIPEDTNQKLKLLESLGSDVIKLKHGLNEAIEFIRRSSAIESMFIKHLRQPTK